MGVLTSSRQSTSGAAGANPISPERRRLLLKSATYASLSVALGLVLVKVWAWRLTDSVSLLSSLADSMLDVVASALTFWAIRVSLSPADAEHRFGHGKSEGLAALLQAVIISGSGLYVVYEAIGRLLAPAPIREAGIGVGVILGGTLLTLVLVAYQRYVSRLTGSVAIAADAMHYKADIAVNIGVALSIALTAFTGFALLDPLVGLIVGAYILWGAKTVATHALDILLDREIPPEDRVRIRDIALQHPEVRGFHDMRTRHGGTHYIVQFHLELDPHLSLLRSHRILDEVEHRIRLAYPGCEIIIHPDPLGLKEPRDDFAEPESGSMAEVPHQGTG